MNASEARQRYCPLSRYAGFPQESCDGERCMAWTGTADDGDCQLIGRMKDQNIAATTQAMTASMLGLPIAALFPIDPNSP